MGAEILTMCNETRGPTRLNFRLGFSLDDRQHPSIFNMSKTDLTIVVLGGDGIGKPLCHSLTLEPSDSDRIDFFW